MRRAVLVLSLVVFGSGSAIAQEWTEYRNPRDGFKALYPGQPAVTETTWTAQTGFILPERVYAVERGRERYSVRVIDYSNVEQLGAERAKKCPPGSETCLGTPGLSGIGYWKHDVRGALVHATSTIMKRDAEVTDFFWNQQDLVSGLVLQLTNKVDQSRSHVYIAMHEMKLYIAEARVPKGSPEPILFVQAVGWVDKDGNGIRYRSIYSHEIHGLREAPVPPKVGAAYGVGAGDAQPR